MDIATLDFYAPFIIFGYGAIMIFVLESQYLEKIAQTRLPAELWGQLQSHRAIAKIAFSVGGLWALQNLWF